MAREKKDPFRMTAAEINRELERLSEKRDKNTRAFIEAGRGHERPSDYRGKKDKLSVEATEMEDRYRDLLDEVQRRAGPGVYRLPTGKGYGPRKA